MRGSLLLALILAAGCGGAQRTRPPAQTPIARVDPGLDVLADPPAADGDVEPDTSSATEESTDSSDTDVTEDDAPEVEFEPDYDDSYEDSFDLEGDEDE